MLKPHVNCQDGSWRGQIEPTDWSAWFESYRDFINHYAVLAQANGIEQLCIGCELERTVSHLSEWREVIRQVKERYTCPITYAANWDSYDKVGFWDALKYAGVDACFPLTDKNNPSMSDLMAAWNKWAGSLTIWQQTINRPVIFTEIGYRSMDGANKAPWEWTGTGTVDMQEQADCYEAAFQVFHDKPWFYGMYWWNWDADPDQGGTADINYTPHNKPAEGVLKGWYKDPAPITTLTVATATFTAAILTWTTPSGMPDSYEVRYATATVTEGTWKSARLAGTLTAKGVGTFIVTGLMPGKTYYFAVKSIDMAGNASNISNVTIGITCHAPVVEHFPLRVGTTWEYNVTKKLADYVGFGTLNRRIIGTEAVSGAPTFVMNEKETMQWISRSEVDEKNHYLAERDGRLQEYGYKHIPSTQAGPKQKAPVSFPDRGYYMFHGKRFGSVEEIMDFVTGRLAKQTALAPTTFGQDTILVYDPPRQILKFPLEIGQEWTMFTDPWTATCRVVDIESVITPAGTFDAYKIQISDSNDVIWFDWYGKAGLVRRQIDVENIQGYDSQANPTGTFSAHDLYELTHTSMAIAGTVTTGSTPVNPDKAEAIVYPNLFNSITTIKYFIPDQGEVRDGTIRIYNISGELVRTILTTAATGNWKEETWNGKNGDGEMAASGVYIYLVEVGRYRISGKMGLVR